MKYALKCCEEEARERHRAFWAGKSLGRPLIYAVARNPEYRCVSWESSASRKSCDLNPFWHLNRIENDLSGIVFTGDAMPAANLMVGLDITNTVMLAGGDYEYSSNGGQVYYKPGSFKLDKPIRPFTPDNPLAVSLMACYDAVIHAVGNRGFVNAPMSLDPLSSLYGMLGTDFLKALIKRPDLIKQRVSELTASYLDFYDYFYDYLKAKGYGESGSWLNVFCEEKFESVRCDFTVMLSTEMFREFAAPMLTQICGHMDRSLFNMSSVAHYRFAEALGDISGLDGFFWNYEPHIEGIKDYLPQLKRLKSLKPCLELVCYSVEDAELATRTLGSDGLYILFPEVFSSVSEAESAVLRINRAAQTKS